MKMTKSALLLLCTTAPFALNAQDVTLQSPDEFISVDGQITGFNGVMVRVQTSVGAVSVPASEVFCFGQGCLEIIASNDFGLTADAFRGVVAQSEPEVVPLTQDLQIAFSSPDFSTLYQTVSGAFAVTGADNISVNLSGQGVLRISGADGDAVTLSATDQTADADIVVETVSLSGTAQSVYDASSNWSGNDAFGQQMIGMRTFSVMAAPNAGINSITISDLARIYAGEVTNWSQIGGADVNVLPLQLPQTSPVRTEMEALVMAPSGKDIAGNVLTLSDEAGIAASINQFPGSVSVISTANAIPALTVPIAGSCGIEVSPTDFNVASGDYPLVGPVMARYTGAGQSPFVTELFDFAATDIVQSLLADEGYSSFSTIIQGGEEKNARLSKLLGADFDDAQRAAAGQMFQVLFGADRMSPTFTGGAASGPEGAWNRAMLHSIIATMNNPDNAGREIVFVGFGSSTSGSQAAIDASAAAAADLEAVLANNARSLIATGGFTLSSHGFGDVSPATCVDGQVAGSEYTRVEVWIR
jgi:ABC-type phosphate transport system substrate-binding protein